MRLGTLFFLGAVLAGCSKEEALPPVYGSEPQDVSMVQLLADPGAYDGRLVRVVGFCRLEFEGNALYLHREDFEQMILKNAVWLDVERKVREDRKDLSDKYIYVEGRFDARDKGHMGCCAGALRDISRMDPHMSRAEVEEMLRRGPSK